MAPMLRAGRASLRSRRSSSALCCMAALGLLGFGTRAFFLPTPAPLAGSERASSLSTRRSMVAALGLLGGAPAWFTDSPAAFADGKEAKAPKPPDAVLVTGRKETRVDINGRWSMLFGKKLNDRAVYKKDGSGEGNALYLMVNNCGQFQMDTQLNAECSGFAIKTEEGWKIDGAVDEAVKMKPWTPKDDLYQIG